MINIIKNWIYGKHEKKIEQLTKEVGELKDKLVKAQENINLTNKFYKNKIWNMTHKVSK